MVRALSVPVGMLAGLTLLLSACSEPVDGTVGPTAPTGVDPTSVGSSVATSDGGSAPGSDPVPGSDAADSPNGGDPDVAASSPATGAPAAPTSDDGVTDPAQTNHPTVVQPAGPAVLGPTGWGDLVLGMSPADAAATGVFTAMPEITEVCDLWQARDDLPFEGAVMSADQGLVAIQARPGVGMRTPEGMAVGWTADQVAAAYPSFDPADFNALNGPTVPVSGNPAAHYRMVFDDARTLSMFWLELSAQHCYG